jgi:hypothetical protein
MKLISATVRLSGDPAGALRDHPDFDAEADGTLTWWGRELTEAERTGALAELKAQLAQSDQPFDPAELGDESPRWLRGRLRSTAEQPRDEVVVEVNSRERLEELLALLSDAGLEPEAARETVLDPTQDFAAPAGGFAGPVPFGTTAESVALWAQRWPDEATTALGGATPRQAARRPDRRAFLEAVLRDLEHDADLLAARGRPVPDFAALRADLHMECWWAR